MQRNSEANLEIKIFQNLCKSWGLNLKQKGVHDNVVQSIKNMNNANKFCVKWGGDKLADTVEQRNGFKQGCILSLGLTKW